MKPLNKLTASLVLLVVPALLRADAEIDRKIESAARASYNYRTVLEDNVKVKVLDGTVTLTGSVPDADQRVLAENTVRDLPGVVQVDNQIKVEPPAPEYSDGWIATKIHTKLLLKSNVSAVDTKVDVKDGVVTLTGTTASLAQKELTTAYVQEIEGVKSVNNLLTVPETPADPRTLSERMDDASITAQVKYALLTHKSTSALRTKVTTKEGMVAIEGEAASAAEKDLVTHLAQGVRGVRMVSNTMTVKG
ncbi:BON domain-containing protein [Opitutus sp. GAS368]|uniref:BON domain-containing protein n=1 Tax=Opitutus sp. GAS368 TaxID=1882749 RepID=UPI000B81C390|nr:BON domain-containing protein [Opitutus sp. GAS368]